MTQGKKKKRAANRSIMLAKKIIIKDGGTVSVGSAPQGGPGAGPASAFAGPGAPSPPVLLSPPPPRPLRGRSRRLGGLRPRPTCTRPRGGGVGPSAAQPGPARRAGRPGSLKLHMLWRVAAAAARWVRVRALSRRGRRSRSGGSELLGSGTRSEAGLASRPGVGSLT